MARNVDLWKHLPPFLKNFREMCGLIDGENPEFNLIAQDVDSMLDEFFIQTATDTGLKRYEKILGISPTTGDSLESRRSAIMTRWHDVTPYTMTALKNRIVAIQGNDDVEIIYSPNRPYEIEIITRLENPGQVNDLAYIIRTMMPCNLIVRSMNIIGGESKVNIGYGVGASMVGTAFLTNDLNADMKLPVPLGVVGTHGVTNTLFLTNDLDESVDIGGTASVGTGGSITNIIEIN